MQIICQALLHPGRFLFKIRVVIPQRMRVEILVIAVTEFRAAEISAAHSVPLIRSDMLSAGNCKTRLKKPFSYR